MSKDEEAHFLDTYLSGKEFRGRTQSGDNDIHNNSGLADESLLVSPILADYVKTPDAVSVRRKSKVRTRRPSLGEIHGHEKDEVNGNWDRVNLGAELQLDTSLCPSLGLGSIEDDVDSNKVDGKCFPSPEKGDALSHERVRAIEAIIDRDYSGSLVSNAKNEITAISEKEENKLDLCRIVNKGHMNGHDHFENVKIDLAVAKDAMPTTGMFVNNKADEELAKINSSSDVEKLVHYTGNKSAFDGSSHDHDSGTGKDWDSSQRSKQNTGPFWPPSETSAFNLVKASPRKEEDRRENKAGEISNHTLVHDRDGMASYASISRKDKQGRNLCIEDHFSDINERIKASIRSQKVDDKYDSKESFHQSTRLQDKIPIEGVECDDTSNISSKSDETVPLRGTEVRSINSDGSCDPEVSFLSIGKCSVGSEHAHKEISPIASDKSSRFESNEHFEVQCDFGAKRTSDIVTEKSGMEVRSPSLDEAVEHFQESFSTKIIEDKLMVSITSDNINNDYIHQQVCVGSFTKDAAKLRMDERKETGQDPIQESNNKLPKINKSLTDLNPISITVPKSFIARISDQFEESPIRQQELASLSPGQENQDAVVSEKNIYILPNVDAVEHESEATGNKNDQMLEKFATANVKGIFEEGDKKEDSILKISSDHFDDNPASTTTQSEESSNGSVSIVPRQLNLESLQTETKSSSLSQSSQNKSTGELYEKDIFHEGVKNSSTFEDGDISTKTEVGLEAAQECQDLSSARERVSMNSRALIEKLQGAAAMRKLLVTRSCDSPAVAKKPHLIAKFTPWKSNGSPQPPKERKYRNDYNVRSKSAPTKRDGHHFGSNNPYKPFKARPLPKTTGDLGHGGQIGVPKVLKRQPTVPSSPKLGQRVLEEKRFNCARKSNSSEPRSKQHQQEKEYTPQTKPHVVCKTVSKKVPPRKVCYVPFKARPLPKTTGQIGHGGQIGVPVVEKRPTTLPSSPCLGKKHMENPKTLHTPSILRHRPSELTRPLIKEDSSVKEAALKARPFQRLAAGSEVSGIVNICPYMMF